MPAVTILAGKHEASQREMAEAKRDSMEPEHQQLWFPSALPSTQWTHNCNKTLIDIEIRLREAQCHDTLEKIRNVQCSRLSFIGFQN